MPGDESFGSTHNSDEVRSSVGSFEDVLGFVESEVVNQGAGKIGEDGVLL